MTTLNDMKPNYICKVIRIEASNILKRRLYDMGITPDVNIFFRKEAPFKDPIEIGLRGYILSLRREEAKSIIVEFVSEYKKESEAKKWE